MPKIIVVDDEPFILMMIEDKLTQAGFDVITFNQSKGVVDVIRKERPDLVIVDWMMPEVSGLDICKALKADPDLAGIPLFMLSAKGQDDDEKLGILCGVDKYVTKPFSPKRLLEMVKEVLGKKPS